MCLLEISYCWGGGAGVEVEMKIANWGRSEYIEMGDSFLKKIVDLSHTISLQEYYLKGNITQSI